MGGIDIPSLAGTAMTLREFRFLIRFTCPHGKRADVVRSWMTPEQLEIMNSKEFVAERNAKKRNISYWQKVFVEQAWRVMFPGEHASDRR